MNTQRHSPVANVNADANVMMRSISFNLNRAAPASYPPAQERRPSARYGSNYGYAGGDRYVPQAQAGLFRIS